MTAGYSGTPLATKLGIKEGHTVVLEGAPAAFAATLEPLPAGVKLRRRRGGTADVLLYFTTSAAELAAHIERLGAAIEADGALWVAWPKRASKVPTDMTEQVVRDVALPLGLVDNKVAALDATWSGLRLVWRRELRADLRARRASR
ncbi:MAG: DUF3052 domain-containing protein [Dehalococcoidia bacterium]|nr:DUF3052 domain-containing protein [Dehalococcoidia bacterium]